MSWLGVGWGLGALALVVGGTACSGRSSLGGAGGSIGTGGGGGSGGSSGGSGGLSGGGVGGSGGTGRGNGTGGGASGGVNGDAGSTGGASALAGHPGTDGGSADVPMDAGPTEGGPSTAAFVFEDPPRRDLDMLFMVDNSASMSPLQTKLVQQFPTFMNVLKSLPGGQPNLHVAVISSSLGAGAFGNVPGCSRPSGDQEGLFQHMPSCVGLPPDQTYLSSIANPMAAAGTFVNNFGGDIADVFSCIALLGQSGCGFEHQFSSTMTALRRAHTPGDPNFGFLRPTASLAIVMLTNEDDCSPAPDYSSTLFDPSVSMVADPSGLGGLQSYRCNEFGHLCNGVPPPLTPPVAGTVTLTDCTSSEGMSPGPGGSAPDPLHQLITVKSFVDFLKGLKFDPNRILVSALAGPSTPYTVQAQTIQLPSGGSELEPTMVHSCMQNTGEFADPGVRIKNWLDAFGSNAMFESICANDFAPALSAIATSIGSSKGTNCVLEQVVPKADGTPTCTVVQTTNNPATGTSTSVLLPVCDATRSVVPCWQLGHDAVCGTGQRFDVCHNAACSPVVTPTISAVNVSCSVYVP